jgi:hypothetical protein
VNQAEARITGLSELVPKTLINWDEQLRLAGVTMRNHDFVSDGFLAVTAAGLVLLCSSLLAFALA